MFLFTSQNDCLMSTRNINHHLLNIAFQSLWDFRNKGRYHFFYRMLARVRELVPVSYKHHDRRRVWKGSTEQRLGCPSPPRPEADLFLTRESLGTSLPLMDVLLTSFIEDTQTPSPEMIKHEVRLQPHCWTPYQKK